MSVVLKIEKLSKRYGSLQAVNGLDLEISQGLCFGLLGPNGAGKSTTIEIIEGVRRADSGQVYFRGRPRGADFKEKIGIQFQATALQDHMSVADALHVFSSFYPHTVPIEKLVETCQLQEFMDREHRKLSGGQRQRLLLALALINDPEVLFLDEPTTGLDPQARANFWELIEKIKKQDKTIVLTTHYMEEAYVLCDEVAIVDRGQVIAQGSPQTLLKKHFQGLKVSFPEELEDRLKALPWTTYRAHNRLEFHSNEIEQTLKTLLEMKIPLDQMEVKSQTLEDLFLELTGRQLREE